MENQSRPNKKLILIPLIVCGALILAAILFFIISMSLPHKSTFTNSATSKQIINGVEWTIDYKVTEKLVNNRVEDRQTEVTIITAQYVKFENTFNGADVKVKITVSLVGKPLNEKDWYKIEKSEVICDRRDESIIYSDSCIRYEEKLVFNLSDND